MLEALDCFCTRGFLHEWNPQRKQRTKGLSHSQGLLVAALREFVRGSSLPHCQIWKCCCSPGALCAPGCTEILRLRTRSSEVMQKESRLCYMLALVLSDQSYLKQTCPGRNVWNPQSFQKKSNHMRWFGALLAAEGAFLGLQALMIFQAALVSLPLTCCWESSH